MELIFNLVIIAFFRCGEFLLCHSELCCLVLGSYSIIHNSSLVMTCLKKFSFSMFSRRSRHTFLRFSFCSLVRFLELALHKFSACPIPRSKCYGWLGDSNSTHFRPHESPHFGHFFVRF